MHPSLRLLTVLAFVAASPAPSETDLDTMRLFDASQPGAAEWRPVHDGVMGGVSTGRATTVEGGVRFAGELSLENNGGFASFRLDERLPDLSEHDGVRLRVRGDGRVYKLRLRPAGVPRGVSWRAPFATTDGEWADVRLTFDEFAPTWRGRLVPDAPPLDTSRLVEVGISIADGRAGPHQPVAKVIPRGTAPLTPCASFPDLDESTDSPAIRGLAHDAIDTAPHESTSTTGCYALELTSIDAWRADDAPRPGSLAAERERTAALASAFDSGVDLDGLLSMLRWDERLLVVSSPSELGVESSEQCGRAALEREGLAARELRVVRLIDDRGGRLAGRTLSTEQVDALRDRWDLDAARWTVALIGKDGGVKERWTSVVEFSEVFGLIDAMPMRRRELDERSSG